MKYKTYCTCSKYLKKQKNGRYQCTNCKKIFTVIKYILNK